MESGRGKNFKGLSIFMVESLKELSAKCQKPRYKEVGNWMVRNILRDAALPMTWLLLHTPVTANQVTLFSIFIGIFSAIFFALPGPGFFLAAGLFLQFWYYLDHVDGQIARYRGTACLTGRFFDFVTHHLIHALILFPLGLYCYHKTGNFIFVIWGFIGTLGTVMFNLIYDVQYKTFFEKIELQKNLQIRKSNAATSSTQKDSASAIKKIYAAFHKAHEIHVMMNILTLAAILQLTPLFKGIDFRVLLFLFYGLLAPFLAVTKTAHFIKTRKIDTNFDETFQISS